MKRILIFCTLMLLGSLNPVQAAQPQATISWFANQENDIGGYRIYQSVSANVFGAAPVVTVPKTTLRATIFLPVQRCNATYYWVVTAYDTMGQESQKSVQVSKTITGTQPWIGACKR